MEDRVKRAQNELQAILTTREEAAILRGRAQERLDEGEAIRADAARISESAWRVFDRGFAVSAKGLPNRWTTVREIDEAMRTHTALQRATHRESWQEADRSRQRATTELLKALAVLNTAMAQAQRELKEAANLPAIADALLQSAQEELRCAQAIRSELLLLGQEALNELDAAPVARQPGPQEITMSDPQDFASGLLSSAGLLGTASPESVESPMVTPGSDPAAPNLSNQGSVSWESPRSTEPEATPEPEISHDEAPEQVEPLLGGSFEAPDTPTIPQASPVTTQSAPPSESFTHSPTDAEPSTVPQVSPQAPQPAPASDWFTEEETPQTVSPSPDAPVTTPQPVIPQVPDMSEAQLLEAEIAAATPASESPGSAATALADELARGMEGSGVSLGSGEAPQGAAVDVESTPVPGAPALQPEPQGMVIEMPTAAQANAADQLRREMEAASQPTPTPETVPPPAPADPVDPTPRVIEMPEPRQQTTAAQLLRQEMAASEPPPPAEIVEPRQAPVSQPAPPPPAPEPTPTPVAAPPPAAAPQAPSQPPDYAPAATYTGRIYLMFPSSLSQGRLESVWEVLDQVAGSGNIIDTRLVSREAGIQFTLDLGDHELNIDALRSKFPDAELVALEEDRLRIDWPTQ